MVVALIGVALDEFKEIRGLCRSINVLLAADEAYISRVLLRTVKFMMLQDGNTLLFLFSLKVQNADGPNTNRRDCVISLISITGSECRNRDEATEMPRLQGR